MDTILALALVAFLISLGAGALGFTGAARTASRAAKVFFGVFLVIALILVVLFVMGIRWLF